ncbi:MAG: response regulator [Marinilabiliaceae bacterium]|nr:response regulator [Marinilabiliaceae bacterium]
MNRFAPTVLLVDDFPLNIEILKGALTRYNNITASNGEEALKKAMGDNKPDLILLDVIMPGLNGYEVCNILKKNDQTKDIPIIFITAKTDQDSILKGFEAGAIDYILKPFNIMELKARVKNQLAIKIARDQNQRLLKRIENINKQMTDSIAYAQKIQTASMPRPDFLTKVLPDHFIFWRPKDIVSGDFYWAGTVESKIIVAVADCTGHGVPGAIMSMFGIAYLNEIVGRKGECKPSVIIDELRRIVINSLQQSEGSEVKDGMDISVVSIDYSTNKLEYAGAFNSMFFIRGGKLTVFQADHMPVSIGEIDKAFKNYEIDFVKGDCVYLFSDGFASQFGGPHDKKLMRKGFKQMILSRHNLNMAIQKQEFEDFFDQWMGDNDQVDDVLLMGIRI